MADAQCGQELYAYNGYLDRSMSLECTLPAGHQDNHEDHSQGNWIDTREQHADTLVMFMSWRYEEGNHG